MEKKQTCQCWLENEAGDGETVFRVLASIILIKFDKIASYAPKGGGASLFVAG